VDEGRAGGPLKGGVFCRGGYRGRPRSTSRPASVIRTLSDQLAWSHLHSDNHLGKAKCVAITGPLPTPIDARNGQCKRLGNLRGPNPLRLHLTYCAAAIEAGGPCTPCGLAFAMPSSCVRTQVRLELGKRPPACEKHLPAAVPVSIGCSSAFTMHHAPLMARTMS